MARLISALVLSILLLIFILQNSHEVSLHFLFWQFNGSLALILLLTAVVIVIITLLIAVPLSARKWFKNRDVREPKKESEQIPISK